MSATTASDKTKRIVALISGRGSNLIALLDAIENGQIAAKIARVISDRADAPGIAAARERGVATEVIAEGHRERHTFAQALADQVAAQAPDLIVLAGFMRILSAAFVNRFDGRIMNIHPSLLPAYRGLDTHRRVLESGETEHGCSVHFVTAALDAGPLIAQAKVKVLPDDTPGTLAARVLEKEHVIYPASVALFCEGRLQQDGQRCLLDGRTLERPLNFASAAQ